MMPVRIRNKDFKIDSHVCQLANDGNRYISIDLGKQKEFQFYRSFLYAAQNQEHHLRGYAIKSGLGRSNSEFSVNIGPTETYYLPNQWKLNETFAELCRLEIAALIG